MVCLSTWCWRPAVSPSLFLNGVSFLSAQRTGITFSLVKTIQTIKKVLKADQEIITVLSLRGCNVDHISWRCCYMKIGFLSVDLCSHAMLWNLQQSRVFFSPYNVHIQVNIKSMKYKCISVWLTSFAGAHANVLIKEKNPDYEVWMSETSVRESYCFKPKRLQEMLTVLKI